MKLPTFSTSEPDCDAVFDNTPSFKTGDVSGDVDGYVCEGCADDYHITRFEVNRQGIDHLGHFSMYQFLSPSV